jgi:hypothetical protein
MGRRFLGVAALVGAVAPTEAYAQAGAAPPPVAADPAPRALELRWSAPADCPDAGYLSAEVSRLTLAASEPRVDVDAKAWKDDTGRWRIALVTQLGAERGERIVEAETCALAGDAAALVIALMIDPEGVRARSSTPGTPEPSGPSVPPVSGADAPAQPTRGEERASLAAAATFDGGSLPSTGFGVGAVAALRVHPWHDRPGAVRLRVEAALLVLPERRARSAVDAARGADLHLVTGAARGVVAYGDVVEGGLFAGLELGSLSGTGFGVRSPVSASTLWNAVLVGAVARFPARGTVGLRGSVEVSIPLRRVEMDVAGEIVHRPSAVIPRGALAAEVRF